MGFYEEIAKYYDDIFKVSAKTVDFLNNNAGIPPTSVLDVACGTGNYSIELAKLGHRVTAVDIDEAMIEGLKAKTKNSGWEIVCLQANMLELKEKLKGKRFDLIFCIGNSLVHLENLNEMELFFQKAKALLAVDGKLVLQTVNYDRVISQNINSLPVIINEEKGLSFERYYRYDKSLNKVFFKTVLTIKGERIENEILLTPLQSNDAIQMLKNAGYKRIQLYGGFNYAPYDKDNSSAMVIEAK